MKPPPHHPHRRRTYERDPPQPPSLSGRGSYFLSAHRSDTRSDAPPRTRSPELANRPGLSVGRRRLPKWSGGVSAARSTTAVPARAVEWTSHRAAPVPSASAVFAGLSVSLSVGIHARWHRNHLAVAAVTAVIDYNE